MSAAIVSFLILSESSSLIDSRNSRIERGGSDMAAVDDVDRELCKAECVWLMFPSGGGVA